MHRHPTVIRKSLNAVLPVLVVGLASWAFFTAGSGSFGALSYIGEALLWPIERYAAWIGVT